MMAKELNVRDRAKAAGFFGGGKSYRRKSLSMGPLNSA